MKKTLKSGVLLAAAMAGLMLTRPAFAQFPVGQDGHANDANNRVGGGGINTARPGSTVTANDIVNRNVTGLYGFSGPIHENDPRAFTGPAPGQQNDAWVRRSQGVPTANGAPQPMPGEAQPFYGDSRFVSPPAGSLPNGFAGGYIGTTLNTPSSLSNGLNVSNATGLQARTLNRDTLLLNSELNPTSFTNLTTGLNDTDALRTASLYGMHTDMAPNSSNDLPILPDFATPNSGDDQTILRMRQELQDQGADARNPNSQQGNNKLNGQGGKQNANDNTQDGTAQPTGLNQPLNQPLNSPLETPVNTVASPAINAQIANDPLSSTGSISTSRSSLIPPQRQSALLDTLQKRLERTTDVGKAMADARANQPQQPAAAKARPANKGPGNGGNGEAEGPVKVSSLATGIKAKGLREVLVSGEELLKEGKYDSAIQKFNQAQRVAPNNPLTVLGRAHAELAGGYYARADQDLRLVFRSAPELLLAQFDLPSLFPKDRVDYLHNDLSELANSDAKSERPWFLMAYLDYNSGKPASAEADLNEAEKRAGRGDWAIHLLRQRWSLPSNGVNGRVAPSPGVTPPARTETPLPDATPTPSPDLNK